MKDFPRTHRCAAAAVIWMLAVAASPSVAAEQLSDARDMANPERMTEPARPADSPAARPSDRNVTGPEATPPVQQPDDVREDEGQRAIVGDPPAAPTAQAPEATEPGAVPPEHPEFDPAIAAEEKPGADDEEAAKPVKDAEQVAAESAHERGFTTVMNDAYITTRVKLSLMVDGRTPASDINVDTENGRVTLFGIVPSDEASEAAEADARAIAGVESVDNTLQVVTEDRKPDVIARDTELQGTVQKQLEPYRSMSDVWVDVKNCVVRLTGTIPPGEEHDQAMIAVRKTPGVCAVKDDLKFTAS